MRGLTCDLGYWMYAQEKTLELTPENLEGMLQRQLIILRLSDGSQKSCFPKKLLCMVL